MHDNKLHDDLAEQQSAPNTLTLELLRSTIERLREQAEPEFVIDGQRYYAFRPFKGRAGYYDRQADE